MEKVLYSIPQNGGQRRVVDNSIKVSSTIYLGLGCTTLTDVTLNANPGLGARQSAIQQPYIPC